MSYGQRAVLGRFQHGGGAGCDDARDPLHSGPDWTIPWKDSATTLAGSISSCWIVSPSARSLAAPAPRRLIAVNVSKASRATGRSFDRTWLTALPESSASMVARKSPDEFGELPQDASAFAHAGPAPWAVRVFPRGRRPHPRHRRDRPRAKSRRPGRQR